MIADSIQVAYSDSEAKEIARNAAREWFVLRGEKYPDEQPAIDELAAVIFKHLTTHHARYKRRSEGEGL